MTGRSAWLGRLITAFTVAAALGLAVWTLYVLDRRPRTDCEHLFAYSAGVTPEVSARVSDQRTGNPQVPGSSPGRGAKNYRGLAFSADPFFVSDVAKT